MSDSDDVRRLPFADEGALLAALREVADQVGLNEDFFQANEQAYDFDEEQFAALITELRRANVGARLWAQPTGDRASQLQITFPGPSTPDIRIHIKGMAWTDLRPSLEVLGVECSDELMESEEEAAERAARFAEGGPVDSVFEFIKAIQAGSFEGDVWPRISQELRRVLAEAWLWANREVFGLDSAAYPEDLVAMVLSGPSAHAAWQAFATTQAGELRTWAEFDVTQYGASNVPRPVGSDCDLVLLINTRGQAVVYGQPALVRAIHVLMRKEGEDWRVAGFAAEVPDSGWATEGK